MRLLITEFMCGLLLALGLGVQATSELRVVVGARKVLDEGVRWRPYGYVGGVMVM